MDNRKSSTFKEDMEQYSQTEIINIPNLNNTNIMKFNDQQICEKLKDWCIIYQNMAIYGIKTKLIQNAMFFKVLYCILTNSVKINQTDCAIDCYNIDTNNKIRVKVIDGDNNIIKIKKNNEYDSVVVIDCSSMNDYKIYEIDCLNLYNIIETYDGQISFNVIVKDYTIKPIFAGDIDDIYRDFKTLAFQNDGHTVEYYLGELARKSIDQDLIEKKIQILYKKMHNIKKVNMKKVTKNKIIVET